MLQQTQVDRVLPKYHEWLAKFPVARGAGRRARGATSPSTWRPLGYNIRPKRLQSIAREAVEQFGGQLPSTRRRCSRSRASARTPRAPSAASRSASAPPSSTPTSPACCSACSSPRAMPKSHAMKRHLWAISEALVPRRHVFDFNQALMDLGATVCTARKPKCLVCPLRGCAGAPVRTANVTPLRDRRHRRGRRTGRALSPDAPARRHAPRRPLGVPGRQMRAWRDAPRRWPAELDEELAVEAHVGAPVLRTARLHPNGRWSCTSTRRGCSAPRPAAGSADAVGLAGRAAPLDFPGGRGADPMLSEWIRRVSVHSWGGLGCVQRFPAHLRLHRT